MSSSVGISSFMGQNNDGVGMVVDNDVKEVCDDNLIVKL